MAMFRISGKALGSSGINIRLSGTTIWKQLLLYVKYVQSFRPALLFCLQFQDVCLALKSTYAHNNRAGSVSSRRRGLCLWPVCLLDCLAVLVGLFLSLLR